MNNKGFTLVELLSVLVIIAVVTSIALSLTKETHSRVITKQEMITANEITDSAKLYVQENNMNWVGDIDEYSCVTMQELKDYGYFKERDIEDYAYLLIKVIRNKDTKVITDAIIQSTCD